MTLYTHTCQCCMKEFTNSRGTAVFCSYACKNIFHFSPDKQSSTPEKKRESSRRWRSRNKIYFRKASKSHYQKQAKDTTWMQKQRERHRQDNKRLRQETLIAYGGFVCSCNHNGVPCGPHPEEFLALDHIGGEGKVQGQPGGHLLFRKLKKQGFPPGYRVLCHNCNCALGFYGYCPHSLTEKQPIRRRIDLEKSTDSPENGACNIAVRGADCNAACIRALS